MQSMAAEVLAKVFIASTFRSFFFAESEVTQNRKDCKKCKENEKQIFRKQTFQLSI
jgi:hypothetical protein